MEGQLNEDPRASRNFSISANKKVSQCSRCPGPAPRVFDQRNSQIQISTRSGTNNYTGSAAWYVRNTALDANSWINNHTPFTDPATGVTCNSTDKPWRNNYQYSVSFGGPVKIPGLYDGKNRTFFYENPEIGA
jgi:hypothetical protein